MSCDLHAHSTASDGRLTPEELVAEALRIHLRALAVSDHDTVAGVGPARRAAEGSALLVVPAVELSAVTADGRGVHVLGYRIDPDEPRLAGCLEAFRADRHDRALRMVAALRDAGYPIGVEDLMRQAGEGSVGRAHVARALTETGAVPSMGDAFRELIGHDRPFYIAKRPTSPARVIGLIRDAGGIAVLAHPGVSRVDDLLEGLIASGLRGIEVWHAEHSDEDVRRYGVLARRLGLLATGGSDYHGPGSSGGGRALGAVPVPDDALDALLDADTG